MPKNDDDGSNWSDEDAIPAVEILNYDLINIGLKAFSSTDERKTSSTPVKCNAVSEVTSSDESSASADHVKTPSKNLSNRDLSGDKVKDQGNLSITRTNPRNDSATRIKYKIGHLPPPETNGNDKVLFYEDHNHFLKHAAVKAKAVRKNSIKNMSINPEDLEADRRPSVAQSPGIEKKFVSADLFHNSDRKAESVDDGSEVSEDEIPAVEILNYDLNNIGLKKLNEIESKETAGTLESSVSKPASKVSKSSYKPSSCEDSSSYSDGEIPAVEILNYDLNNVGLRSLDDRQEASKSRILDTEDGTIKNSSEPRTSTQQALETDGSSKEENVALEPQRDLDSSAEEAANELLGQAPKKVATLPADDSSENSIDEIPAIEILNYDLNNVGLKSFDASKSALVTETAVKKSAPLTMNNSAPTDDDSEFSEDEIPAVEILNYDLNNAGLKAFGATNSSRSAETTAISDVVAEEYTSSPDRSKVGDQSAAVTKSNGNKQLSPSKDDLSDQSEDEIPAVEILNYDLINIGLKQLSGDEVEATPIMPLTKIGKECLLSETNNGTADSTSEGEILYYDLVKADKPQAVSTRIESNVAPLPLPLRTESTDDCSSQQTRLSSVPGKDGFDDHGHFLSIAAEKVTSKQKNRNVTSEVKNENETFMTIARPQAGRVLHNERLDRSQHTKERDSDACNGLTSDMSMQQSTNPCESAVKTVVTTKTIVEPDGTVVTTTTVVTKTMISSNNTQTPQSNLLSTINDSISCANGSKFEGDTETLCPLNSNTTSGKKGKSMILSSSEVRNKSDDEFIALKTTDIENGFMIGGLSGCSERQDHPSTRPAFVGNADVPNDSLQFTNSIESKKISENAIVTPSHVTQIRNSDGIESQAIDSHITFERINDVSFERDEVRESKGVNFSHLSNQRKTYADTSNELLTNDESISNGSSRASNSLRKVERNRNELRKDLSLPKRDKFEDHVDFLSEAASYQSELDLQSLAEEEKRNDEVAMRKILSFGSSVDVSPLTSPAVPMSSDINSLGDKQPISPGFTCFASRNSLESADKNDSDNSDSDWSEGVSSKQILNYDLNGLKELRP